ncbi:cystatin domain-containing protein [Ditylenchus destructor]|uniref:Cystatin domain-containing protein n=1 Tax=Ditylenchus destructor TaxID=166010 RepID=A0AAD4RAM2_9BILA|nr:cystatin domain-containing protein [Ditylenchus destructor]
MTSNLYCSIAIFLAVIINISKSEMLVGGWVEHDVNKDEIKNLSKKVIHKLNAESNDMFYQFPKEILSAKSQVVSGIQYELKILVGKSSCKKNEVASVEFDETKCQEQDENARKVYTAKIWIKEWENFEEITITKDNSAENE